MSVNTVYNKAENLNISFKLSLLQRIFNPFERLFLVLLAICMYGRVITLLIAHFSLENLLVTLFFFILITLFSFRFFLSFYKEVIHNIYPNKIIIEDGLLSYGWNSFDDKEMYVFHYEKMAVYKGLFKTYIVKETSYMGQQIILPHNIISYEYLKQIIERK